MVMKKFMKTDLARRLMGVASVAVLFPVAAAAQDAVVAGECVSADTLSELATGVNTVWMLLAAMLVFFMQPGFALVEAGFTRSKNTANILMKNFVDFIFGSLDRKSVV